jgi:hypothetical protein
LRGDRVTRPGKRRRSSSAAFRRSCDRRRTPPSRPAGWPTPYACRRSAKQRCGP